MRNYEPDISSLFILDEGVGSYDYDYDYDYDYEDKNYGLIHVQNGTPPYVQKFDKDLIDLSLIAYDRLKQ